MATSSRMTFDSSDFAQLNTTGIIDDVVLHEMAHAIGFGSLWNTHSLVAGTQQIYTAGTGIYNGTTGNSGYSREIKVGFS